MKSSKDIDSNREKVTLMHISGSPRDKDSVIRIKQSIGEMNQVSEDQVSGDQYLKIKYLEIKYLGGSSIWNQVSEGQMDQGQTEGSTGEIIPGKVSKEYQLYLLVM